MISEDPSPKYLNDDPLLSPPVQQSTLTIVPPSKNRVYQRALGKSALFTCTANVEVPERLTEFRWWWPDGRMIEATDNRYLNNYNSFQLKIH